MIFSLQVVYCLLALVVASQAQWQNNYDAGIKPVIGDYSAPPPAAYPPADDYPAPYQPYKPPQHYQYRPENPVLYREIPAPLPVPVHPASVILPTLPYSNNLRQPTY